MCRWHDPEYDFVLGSGSNMMNSSTGSFKFIVLNLDFKTYITFFTLWGLDGG